jgi:hypothetical protein
MNTEDSGWTWVVRGVMESLVLLVGLSLFGSLAVTLLG